MSGFLFANTSFNNRIQNPLIKLNRANIHMSKHLKSFLILSTLLLFGCKDDPTPSIEEEFDIPVAVKEPLVFEYLIHDVEGIVFNMLFDLHERDQGEAATHASYNIFDGRGECADQDLNTDNNRLSLNFKDGCLDDSERYRQGQITIDYSDPLNRPGTIIDVTLTGYLINQVGLNGTLRIENISQTNSDDVKTYQLSFSNLELSIKTESSIFSGTRNIHYEKEDGNVFETTELTYLTSSNLSLTLQNGNEYAVSTPTSMNHAFSCWKGYAYFPFSGKQIIEGNNTQTEIDYIGCNYTFDIKTADDKIKRLDLKAIL